MRIVTIVRKVAPRCYPNYLKAFEDGDEIFDRFKINTPLRIAHFLAQALYETGRGTVLFESLKYKTTARLLEIFGIGHHSAAIRPDEVDQYLNNDRALAERVYGLGNPKKAKELGNSKPGDGYKYRGGGLLQTTGGANYLRMGKLAGVDFYNNPDLIVAPEAALLPALHEWNEGGLNAYADRNDIRTITRLINGGYNGLSGRTELVDIVWSAVGKSGANQVAWKAATTSDETRELQEALNDLGAEPALVVDGRYGPATAQAVEWFQNHAKIPVDGNAGVVTQAALNLRLNSRTASERP
ncbi:peptidoglycan-binding protein [Bradyrhizobium sp. SBR1B]|uniref:peptidoglycan-binding protein n=1 Tax=Bradyrhizobium sp. SBR1B TaxID=2663836 RepID=UPI00160650A8|nr:peptidoglycan-binding protein [Bradyrhizobium sp. SBR1B]MBB4381294.1 putative chitinase [Bradyrhizobium sp. SBR1B]